MFLSKLRNALRNLGFVSNIPQFGTRAFPLDKYTRICFVCRWVFLFLFVVCFFRSELTQAAKQYYFDTLFFLLDDHRFTQHFLGNAASKSASPILSQG